MSLLTEAMETMQFMDKTTGPDGYGGITTIWVDGAQFQAALALDTSLEALKAEKEGVKSTYTVITSRSINLVHGDILKRVSDGPLLRVTTDGTDKRTPLSAGLDMRAVKAEPLLTLP